MHRMATLLLISLLLAACGSEPPTARPAPEWTSLNTGLHASCRGLAASSAMAVIGGAGGALAVSRDHGLSWRMAAPAGSDSLDFRDVAVLDDATIIAMSAGPGQRSRIYRSTDGGATWTERHRNREGEGFLNAVAFWDAQRGLAVGDPIGLGLFQVLLTDDGGRTWRQLPDTLSPQAVAGEYGFAASGTNLVTAGQHHAWIGTGGGAARVLRSVDGGRTWQVAGTPLPSGSAGAGGFSLAFADTLRGIAAGGDYQRPDSAATTIALTDDGGRTWRAVAGSEGLGYRSGSAWIANGEEGRLVTVGPGGTAMSTDGGDTWSVIDRTGYHAVTAGDGGTAWVTGAAGRAARVTW